jgi:hypothetical protein
MKSIHAMVCIEFLAKSKADRNHQTGSLLGFVVETVMGRTGTAPTFLFHGVSTVFGRVAACWFRESLPQNSLRQ